MAESNMTGPENRPEAAPAADAAPQRAKRQMSRPARGVVVTVLFAAGLLLAGLLLTMGLRLQNRRRQPVEGLPVLQAASGTLPTGLPTTGIVAAVANSVVSIDLYDERGVYVSSSGSGVVLSADGYIATCNHVISGAGNIRVVLADGRGFAARVVGGDAANDLAVLKISAQNLAAAVFGDSDAVVVGQRVVSIGNAAGRLPGSPSEGIVSGVGRSVPLAATEGAPVRMDLIQTDAAINPGTSGGALADENGRVIGICIGKIEDAAVDNIGFAIPAARALPVLQALMETGGAPGLPALGAEMRALAEGDEAPGRPREGLLVERVTRGGALAALGVAPGDVIVAAGGEIMRQPADVEAQIERHFAAGRMDIEVFIAAEGVARRMEVLLRAG